MAGIVEQLTSGTRLKELLSSGESFNSIAKRYGCCSLTVRKAARALRLKSRYSEIHQAGEGILAVAPTPQEEEMSQNSLRLAPSVAELAFVVRENALRSYQLEVRSPYARKP